MTEIEKKLADLTKFFFENCDFEVIDDENSRKEVDFTIKKSAVKTGVIVKDFSGKSCGINVICSVDRLRKELPTSYHNLCVVSNSFSVPAENLARIADILILPRGHMVSFLRSKGIIDSTLEE